MVYDNEYMPTTFEDFTELEDYHSPLDGPFDIEDFDDPTHAEPARLDLGSLLIPVPEDTQIQVELSETGVPATVWFLTPYGRFSICAYAAPKTPGLWREVASEIVETLRCDTDDASIIDGPWGREITATIGNCLRFIGIDGYRWMIRCIISGSAENMSVLIDQARQTLADTVVRRGEVPLPVRTPLSLQLPESMEQQLRQAIAAQSTGGGKGFNDLHGSAMQQLRG